MYPRCVYVCLCMCVCSHVCSWLISYAVWIQQRLSLFSYRTEDKACHNNISRSSSRRAAVHTHSHARSDTQHLHIWVHNRLPLPRLHAHIFNVLFNPRENWTFFTSGWPKSRARNKRHHSHLLTELTISLPRSEIGSSEKHTIRNHYSAPNCRWQAWARQMRKWKDYNTISLSCTHLLIHLPGLNKCIHLKMIWQTVPSAWIRDTAATEKNIIYLQDALHR